MRVVVEAAKSTTEPLTDAEYARVLARYASMRSRSTVLRFLTMGPLVKASTPEEMVEATIRAWIEAAEAQDPS
jgi:hypothetical protein